MEPGVTNQDSDPVQSYIIEQTSQQLQSSQQLQPQSGEWSTLVHGTRFTNNGKYICGYVDSSPELLQLLESYRSITGTTFSSSQNLVQAIKTLDENQLQMRFMSPASRPRLFWQMNAGEPTIQYDGVPFMSIGHGTDLPCVRFGGRRKKIEQVSLPSGEVVPVDYRMKTGCEAKITIRRILRYPCAEYTETMVQGIAAIRRQRKQILEDLVQRIVAGTAKAQERFYFLLPTPLAHTGHGVSEIDAPAPIAQQVLDEIIAQLSNGVTSLLELHDHVKSYIMSCGGGGAGGSDSSSSGLYCLSELDIFQQVYWLYKVGQVMDQDVAIKGGISLTTSSIEQALTQQQQQHSVVASHVATTSSATGSVASAGNVSRNSREQQQQQEVSAITSAPLPPPSGTDAITSVYSIIMDDPGSGGEGHRGGEGGGGGGGGGGGATGLVDQLGAQHQMTTTAEQEIELHSGETASIHHASGGGGGLGGMDASPISQIQIGNSSISISPVGQIQSNSNGHHQLGSSASPVSSLSRKRSQMMVQGGGGSGGGGHTHIRGVAEGGASLLRPATSSGSFNSSYRTLSNTGSPAPPSEEDEGINQAQIEVQNMLKIIENQTHACTNLTALNSLRRQLTELCGQFSMHLNGVPSAMEFGAPQAKRTRTLA